MLNLKLSFSINVNCLSLKPMLILISNNKTMNFLILRISIDVKQNQFTLVTINKVILRIKFFIRYFAF